MILAHFYNIVFLILDSRSQALGRALRSWLRWRRVGSGQPRECNFRYQGCCSLNVRCWKPNFAILLQDFSFPCAELAKIAGTHHFLGHVFLIRFSRYNKFFLLSSHICITVSYWKVFFKAVLLLRCMMYVQMRSTVAGSDDVRSEPRAG